MDVYDHPSGSQQDYDVPTSNRSVLDLPGASATFGHSRRASSDSQRSGPGSRPGSRKASLANDLYDTPPSSKRASGDTTVSNTSNISGVYDTPPSSKRASSERTPPPSNRSSSTSRDSASSMAAVGQIASPSSSLNHLNLPSSLQHRRRSGGSNHSSDNCYETPPGSNRSSLERILSEEGPPIYESLSPASSTDHLAGDVEEPTYDTPPNRGPAHLPRQQQSRGLSHTSATSQSSLHSAPSIESLLSNTSGLSGTQLSHNTSLPDSARSSMDLPADTYDVPPSAQHDGEASRKQLSTDSGLGFYDSPVKSRPSSSTSGSNMCPPSQNGTLKSSQSTFNCKPSPSSSSKDIKRSRSLEHALDDLYDTPRNNAPKVNLKKLSSAGSTGYGSSNTLNDPAGVYDIPPQVTRDSVISARSDSSNEENQRLSSSSLECERPPEHPVWDVLPLDLDSALEVLVKRQQDVSKATSRLDSFVTDEWRTRASLEKTLYDIKVACSLVKNSLQEFVDFSLKAFNNALRLPDRQLAARLQKQVSPLQSTLEFVNKSFCNLEEAKWQVALLSEPLPKNKPDDLGQIALVAKDLLPEVKRVASFIQSNGTTLFKRSSDYKSPSVSSKPPKAPGNGFGTLKQSDIQHRPLPAVPGSTKESNRESPANTAVPDVSPAVSKLSLYDIKSAIHSDDYEECDAIPSPPPEQSHQSLLQHLAQEYDYVELDAKETREAAGEGSADSGLGGVSDHNSDMGTLKARRSREGLEEKTITGYENATSAESGSGSGGSIDYDVDTIPVKENTDGDEKTPTNKAAPDSSSFENAISFPADVEALSNEEDVRTPINLTGTASDPNQSQAFVLPQTEDEVEEEEVLDASDRQVLIFYADQMTSHATLLANATDAFLKVVADGQPPNVFISHSKFLIVSAHKLVHIGDSIHRNLASNYVSTNIMRCANNLCDCLKASVTATKMAALQYPSGPALQEMVDRVMAVSHAAHELRLVIKQAIK
ncbi:breast cancer anti-estrogen resistance protein 1 [Plakobranchus ocellatus]|uniref:Breast cancer anti-estrogen resistance protein 1 n=1 Tax=Plakobranchus ocellatus TaxID=259542 RepID=A0AAV4C1W2_9GAST|nr:breast cancer anti-estrogen resistance protein 1 [Plakobranchus ocellatus]